MILGLCQVYGGISWNFLCVSLILLSEMNCYVQILLLYTAWPNMYGGIPKAKRKRAALSNTPSLPQKKHRPSPQPPSAHDTFPQFVSQTAAQSHGALLYRSIKPHWRPASLSPYRLLTCRISTCISSRNAAARSRLPASYLLSELR